METLRDKRTFLQDLKIRRCLIPADGFYERKVLRRGKGPYRILRTDNSPMVFAGIWEEGAEGVNTASRFAIVTTEANAFMRPIHSRMPVILDLEEERRWLDGKTSLVDLISILKTPPRQKLRAYAVSKAVNKASVDTPELIEPITRSAALFE